MATTTSVTVDLSPMHSLPTIQPVMKQTKAHRFRQCPSPFRVSASPSHFQKIVAELLGTYILIFVGCGSILVNQFEKITIVGIALVWGLVVMALVYALGHVSGAHFNPAVTIAFAASRKLPWKQLPTYVLSQVLGAILASVTLRLLFNHHEHIRFTVSQFSDATTAIEAVIWEFIMTFILMFTVCGVATDYRASKDFAGVAIGATVLFNVIVAGPISGCSMNPARSLGPALVSGVYKNLWVYMVGPTIGAIAATMVYSVVRVAKPEMPQDTNRV